MDGALVGDAVEIVGVAEGLPVGCTDRVGDTVGVYVGNSDGKGVGLSVACVGNGDGDFVEVGDVADGTAVGNAVGTARMAPQMHSPAVPQLPAEDPAVLKYKVDP